MAGTERIIPINIEDEMKSAYIDYSMSVIVARALPDVRDGLKPVHRRILFGMNELGITMSKGHKKSARIVGEVLGKYHPHGDTAVYDAMVRLAQEWNMRYPLIDKQGNFGSIEGDRPAAMRYTEARLARISDDILGDLKKDTVDWRFNFDDSLKEPVVLPSKIPALLVNGASGIAVGMATNMMPHNLTEVMNALIASVDNPGITIDELIENYVTAPDFPTGGVIYGMEGIREALHTGRGRVVLRGKAEVEVLPNGREVIIITEIPYQINQQTLEIKIKDAIEAEKVQGISGMRNESDRNGIRIVLELKMDAMGSVTISQLFKFTPLQTSYGVNNVVLVNGRPQTLNLKQLLDEFIKFRIEVIVKRTKFDLKKAQDRAHILEGLLIALNAIDEVIALIRASKTVEEAKQGLMKKFSLSEIQAKAILEIRLMRLVSMEIDKVQAEYDELMGKIKDLKDILSNEERQKNIFKEECIEVRDKYGDERRTMISHADGEISIEDMIPNERMIITISHLGYIKRTEAKEYKQQGRGGRGSKGTKTRVEDFIEHIFAANAHNYLLFFTEKGTCYWIRVYELPVASKGSQGRVIQNLVALPKDDKVKAYIVVEDLSDEEVLKSHYIVFATKRGLIKKTSLEAFSRPRVNGIIAININDDDMLLEAKLTKGDSEIFLANKNGRAIRFPEGKVRSMGRTATGVRGIVLDNDEDEVVGMVCTVPDSETNTVLVLSQNGYGKRTFNSDYRVTNRGGKGVKTLKVTDKTGQVIGIKGVSDLDHLMIVNKSGIMIRLRAADLRVMGRATQGVKLISLDKNDQIADLAILKNAENDEEEE
ncbi:MAG: DNA gyrase subunit A [Saprospiraceae bacterium]